MVFLLVDFHIYASKKQFHPCKGFFEKNGPNLLEFDFLKKPLDFYNMFQEVAKILKYLFKFFI